VAAVASASGFARRPSRKAAQAMTAEENLVEDFHFEQDRAILQVVNAPSPAATLSPGIGGTIAEKVIRQLS
jgi:L-2-hydroxyglutarate oxidase LhgO